ncbi:MAG TPA: DinB family protein [Casimicrobiaceae bacterium]
MTQEAARYLVRQFETAWNLTAYHLRGLTTEECMWRPSGGGPHLEHRTDGTWYGRMPDREDYGVGPPSIGWLTWHIGFWWSMVMDHAFGSGLLTQEQILWPGSAAAATAWIESLHRDWQDVLHRLTDSDLASPERTRWPFRARPFGDVVAWVNIELTKNASEIGYGRFLYATRDVAQQSAPGDAPASPP